MELDQKIRYAILALAVAGFVLAALGIHSGLHVRASDFGGGPDQPLS